MKTEREFEPGQAPVYLLPQRDPMRFLADWGAPPSPPISPGRPGAYERPWDSPGPPPWADQAAPGALSRGRTPRWAVAAVLVGSALVLIAVTVLAVLAVLNG